MEDDKKLFCAHCGAILNSETKFCPKCGTQTKTNEVENVSDEIASTVESNSTYEAVNRQQTTIIPKLFEHKKIAIPALIIIIAIILFTVVKNSGATSTQIINAMQGRSITVNGDHWALENLFDSEKEMTFKDKIYNPFNGTTYANIQVKLKNDLLNSDGTVKVELKKNENGEWNVDKVECKDFKYEYNKDAINIPVDKLRQDLYQTSFSCKGNAIDLNEGDIKSLKVIKKSLKNKGTEQDVIVKVAARNGIINLKGNLDIKYLYFGGWSVNTVKENGKVSFNYKTPSESTIKADLIGQRFVYGQTKDNFFGFDEDAYWNIEKGEISDFKINNKSIDGSYAKVNVSVKFSGKDGMVISGKLDVTYYSDGSNWRISEVSAPAYFKILKQPKKK